MFTSLATWNPRVFLQKKCPKFYFQPSTKRFLSRMPGPHAKLMLSGWGGGFAHPKVMSRFLDLPRGAEWMIRGAYTPSLRVQTAPFGRCWFINLCFKQPHQHGGCFSNQASCYSLQKTPKVGSMFQSESDTILGAFKILRHIHMGVSKNRSIPKWMVYSGKPY